MHSEQPQNDWQTAGMARRAKGWLAGSITLGGMAAVLFVLHLTLLAGLVDDLTFKGASFGAEQHTVLLLLAYLGGSLLLIWQAQKLGCALPPMCGAMPCGICSVPDLLAARPFRQDAFSPP
ncbi:hypothetical protein [Acetobacter malorum]|uniref:hypothetical protein n=1 Tax=Acetobacter malorum TaxID=178901 RepID=UPI001E31E612|nr:hypothetical protein [Acetobacter malorum]